MNAIDFAKYNQEVYKIRKMVDVAPKIFHGIPLPMKPSPADARNYQYPALLQSVGFGADIKGPFGYRKNLPPAFDQKWRGACTAVAKAATVKAFQEINQGDYPEGGLSSAFLYVVEKDIDGMPNVEGSTPQSGYIVLQKTGICTEKAMSYDTLLNLPAPQVPKVSEAAMKEAAKYKIDTYAQIASPVDDRRDIISTMRRALAREGPFTIDILVCENFVPDPKSHIAPKPQGLIRGLHELAVTDDLPDIQCFEIRNSWGPEWGDQGYCYFSYDWFTGGSDTYRWTIEAWTSTDIVVPRASNRIVITPGQKVIEVDGQLIEIDQPAEITSANRLMLPVRSIAANLGYTVAWDGKKAILTKPTQ